MHRIALVSAFCLFATPAPATDLSDFQKGADRYLPYKYGGDDRKIPKRGLCVCIGDPQGDKGVGVLYRTRILGSDERVAVVCNVRRFDPETGEKRPFSIADNCLDWVPLSK
ncbi:MAG: hypothetical protein IT293_08405 [Deltaproteobacteria bacterium]|nr:hypothetical protein [Deltaproteobacteria bacterium]